MDANELSQMRATIENDLLPGTCTILAPTEVNDGYGGVVTTWGTASASEKCRLDPLQGREQVAAGEVGSFHRYMLTLPYNATITTDYRVVIGASTYNVISIDTNKSWMASVRCIVERV